MQLAKPLLRFANLCTGETKREKLYSQAQNERRYKIH